MNVSFVVKKKCSSVFAPCGHKCCCSECAEKIIKDLQKKCPLCKGDIKSLVNKIFE